LKEEEGCCFEVLAKAKQSTGSTKVSTTSSDSERKENDLDLPQTPRPERRYLRERSKNERKVDFPERGCDSCC
jgi:hypothetical protein